MKQLRIRLCGLCVMLCCSLAQLYAQDTVRIMLPQAEEIFINKNLSLLAGKYNINIAEAEKIQAKLYPNPNISANGNIYNPELKKPFDISNATGQYGVSAQQLILLAGKRNKQIKMAETGIAMAENSFYDLLRTLQYTLRSDFYKALYLQNSITAYQFQIVQVEKLNNNFQQLLQNETVTLKDAVRIKSLLYSLKTEQALLQNQFNDAQAEIQQLLQDNNSIYIPIADSNVASQTNINSLLLQSLIDTAYNNRPDLKLANNSILFNQQNLTYQKSLATPDITIGAEFDKRGNFVENAAFFTVAMDLPFFTRNQGNIKAAKFNIEQSKLMADKQKLQVENDVQRAYNNATTAYNVLNSIDPNFRNQFEQLIYSVTQNFEKRNLSILDFTDFYESYKQNILQINEVQDGYMQALEYLNFTCGKKATNN